MSPVDIKIVLLGSEAVGKTCLSQRYINNRFNESTLCQNVSNVYTLFFCLYFF